MPKVTLIILGNKPPQWVVSACDEFSKRLQEHFPIQTIEIPLLKRNKDLKRILERESQLMKAAIPAHSYLIALDKSGRMFSSEVLANHIEQITQNHGHLTILIGGPEGLSADILQNCAEKWSLSHLTFPHTLARVIIHEALYRTWSIQQNHPYHK